MCFVDSRTVARKGHHKPQLPHLASSLEVLNKPILVIRRAPKCHDSQPEARKEEARGILVSVLTETQGGIVRSTIQESTYGIGGSPQ